MLIDCVSLILVPAARLGLSLFGLWRRRRANSRNVCYYCFQVASFFDVFGIIMHTTSDACKKWSVCGAHYLIRIALMHISFLLLLPLGPKFTWKWWLSFQIGCISCKMFPEWEPYLNKSYHRISYYWINYAKFAPFKPKIYRIKLAKIFVLSICFLLYP